MHDTESYFNNSLSLDDYIVYISKWSDGIYSEIEYWNNFICQKIDNNLILIKKNSSTNSALLNYQDTSYLEEELSYICENSSVLDVGCGAVPFYKYLLKEKNITFHSVDLLSNVYKNIYSNMKIEMSNLPQLGLVEALSLSFSQDKFDVVHMSNALDHCFDPILGLWQMLYVCKTGGKIILRHNCNEAERENYKGLHQWNIDIEEGKFIIWRNNKKYDIAKLLEGYAVVDSFFLTKLISNPNIGVNFAVIKKIAPSPLYINPYINQLTISLLSEYSLKIYDNMLHEKEILYSLLRAGLDFKEFHFENYFIFGAGFYGKCVYRVLNRIGIKVKCVFDKKNKYFCDSIKVEPYSSDKVNSNDCIIIASQAYKEEIERLLLVDSKKRKFKYIKISE